MHVGLNLVYLAADSGGTGTYARGLIPALLEADPGVRLTLFTSKSAPPQLRRSPWADAVSWIDLPVRGSGGPPWTFVTRTAAQWAALPLIAARRRIDVVHGLSYIAPVVRGDTATVVSVHDLIWRHDPGSMTRLARAAIRMVAPPSIRAADRVITGSAYAADDIRSTLGIPARRIAVVPHGPGDRSGAPTTAEDVLRRRLRLGDGPYVLAVGQRFHHKNLGRLIEAIGLLGPDAPRLLLAGPTSPQDAQLRETARALGIADKVLILGWVSSADLEGLYAAAACLALPSLQEGFGFSAVEAMARGVPVACSATSSLADTVGDAGLLFDAERPASIAAALRRLLDDPALRADLIGRGRARALALTWRACAEGTLAAYADAVDARRSGRRH
jgi:glycosyltransferase involved in cell wall biosynthesis